MSLLALPEIVLADSLASVPEIKGFERWNSLVKDLTVESWMLGLCSPPFIADDRFLSHMNSKDGSTSLVQKKVSVYANDLAYEHVRQGAKNPFPVGSIIVKEKIRDPINHPLNSLGIMIKREVGFDKGYGDWEFLFVEPNQQVVRGSKELKNCYSCHQTGNFAQKTASDYVFVSAYEKRPNQSRDADAKK